MWNKIQLRVTGKQFKEKIPQNFMRNVMYIKYVLKTTTELEDYFCPTINWRLPVVNFIVKGMSREVDMFSKIKIHTKEVRYLLYGFLRW
jgi:hypothetical protein